METNQNRSSQPQGKSNQFSQGNSSSSQGNAANSNASQSSSSSVGGLNMNNLTQQLQKYSTPIMNKVNSLSTTQKVVGGALLAAGAGWLAMKPQNRTKVLNNFKKTAANKKLK